MFQTFVELALILIIFATHDLSIYLGFTARQHNTENQITSKHILPLISQKESNIHKKIKKKNTNKKQKVSTNHAPHIQVSQWRRADVHKQSFLP